MDAAPHNRHIADSAAKLAAIGADGAKIAIILGSGLGGLDARLENAKRISYADLPGFPKPGVAGHAGVFCYARRNDSVRTGQARCVSRR